jgi:hypothetical protein
VHVPRQINGLTYTLTVNTVCFQMITVLKSLVSFILLMSVFYRDDGLIFLSVSRFLMYN